MSRFSGKCPACGSSVHLEIARAVGDTVEAFGTCAGCGRSLAGRAWVDYQGYLKTEVVESKRSAAAGHEPASDPAT